MDDQPPENQPQPQPPDAPRPPLAPPPIIYAPPPAKSGSSAIWKVLALVFLALLCLSIFGHIITFSRAVAPRARAAVERNRSLDEVVLRQTNSDDKIAVITVDGVIGSGADERTDMDLTDFISEQLSAAERDSDVKAVILKVDSPGGEVMASDDINSAITRFQDESHKPVVVSMGSLAASGGYYISAPCRWIVANELTLTGSIGVIMDSYNYRLLMDKVGILPQVFKSGRFKDMLSGEREPDSDKLSPEDRKTRQEEDEMVQSFINETYNKFKDVVKTGRARAHQENGKEGRSLAPNWQDFADGRVLSGRHAMELGFVDELGDFDVAVKRAEKLVDIPSASLVEYRVPFDFQSVLSHVFGKSSAPAIKVDLGVGSPLLQSGRFYYIWPKAVGH